MRISKKNSPKYDLIKLFVIYCAYLGIENVEEIEELALKRRISHAEITRTYWQHLKRKGVL